MTTEAKAKELRPYVEKMVTQARSATAAQKRLLNAKLLNQESEVKKLVEKIAPRYESRAGGYTRITKLPARKSDGAAMAIIEFV